MMQEAVFSALRKASSNYLFGHNRKKSRANGLNMVAFWLFWPNHTLSMETLRALIDQSFIPFGEKIELKKDLDEMKNTWPAKIEETIRSISNGLEKDSAESESQPPERLVVRGIELPSDLPSGGMVGIDQDIARYRSLTLQEFTSCKFKI